MGDPIEACAEAVSSPGAAGVWRCSRIPEHSGAHVAEGKRKKVLAVWGSDVGFIELDRVAAILDAVKKSRANQ